MGFLQGDTNNIILDAVLTDTGRRFLARNDGSFSVIKFALGDDEVDYSIITKFGRTVGKEKIEKNTPIFEALTNGTLAQKYRCISVSNPNLVRLPNIGLASNTNNIVRLGTTSAPQSITVAQQIVNENAIDDELIDQSFIVEMNNLFLTIQSSRPVNIDNQRKATYILNKDSTVSVGSQRTFTIAAQPITDSQFSVFGAINNKSRIDTYLKVTGVQSGAFLEFQVQIYKGNTPTT